MPFLTQFSLYRRFILLFWCFVFLGATVANFSF